MSYEDIKEARAKRATKEVIKGKGKRGWKRKSAVVEADEPEPEPEEARDDQSTSAMEGPSGADDLSAGCGE